MTMIDTSPALLAAGQILLAMTLVIAMAGVASLVMRRHPAARERLWRAALFGVFLSPLVPWISGVVTWKALTFHLSHEATSAVRAESTLPTPSATANPQTSSLASMPVRSVSPTPPTRIIPPPNESATATPPVVEPTLPTPTETAPTPVKMDESQQAAEPTWNVKSVGLWLAVLWATGLLWQLARLAIGSLRCRRVLAGASPLDANRFATELRAVRDMIGTVPPVVVSPAARGPGVIGLLRGQIVLPAQILDWIESDALVQVIIHEAAHIHRRDPLVNLLQVAASCLFWPHPLVHWLNRRLREAREEVCDNFVLAHTRPSSYAETLLRVAERCPFPAPSPAGLAMVPRRGSLERRVGDLLDSRRNRATDWPWSRRLLVQTGLLGVLVVVGLVRIETDVAGADEPTKPSATTKSEDADQQTASDTMNASKSEAKKPIAHVTGRVLMPDGAPVEGATVILLGPPNNGGGYSWPLPIEKTKSDKQGRYSFEITTPGRYELWANLEGMTSRTRLTDGKVIRVKKTEDTPEPVKLELYDAVTVRVLIKDAATGKPIPGATVDLGWSDFTHTFTANESGVAIVQPLPAQRWQFQAFAEGHAKQWRWLNLQGGKDAQTTFLLEPGAAISGKVRNEAGEPVAGAGVAVNVPGAPPMQFQRVSSDEQGRYRIENIPLTKVKISSSPHEYEPTKIMIDRLQGDRVVDITLSPREYAGAIRGIVVDEQGEPIAGATVLNQGRSSADERKATTGPDGRFELKKMFAGVTGPAVTVSADGYAPNRVLVDPGPANDPAEVTITLEPGHSIQGRVVDQEGEPIRGVRVYFAGAYHGSQLGGSTKTDKRGRFSFDSLPANTPFAFIKSGYSEIERRELPLDGEDVVTVVMKTEGIIKGRVIDAKTGEPIETFNVRVSVSPKRKPGAPMVGIAYRLMDPGQTFQSREGRFKIDGLAAGSPLQVTVEADGYKKAVKERIVAQTDSKVEQVTFSLTPVDPSTLTTYAGRVIGPDGKPVAGAQVRLIALTERDSKSPYSWVIIETGQIAWRADVVRFEKAVTDANGRFTFKKIPKSAKVELAWWGENVTPGRRYYLEKLDKKERTSIAIKLPKPAKIVGTFDREAFPKAPSVSLNMMKIRLGYETKSLKPDATTFEFDHVPPGTFSVYLQGPREEASGPGGGFSQRTIASEKVTAKAGEVIHVKFTAADKRRD